jgi:hypothetical protein
MSEGRFSVLKSIRKPDRASLITDADQPDSDPATIPVSNHYGSVDSAEPGKTKKKKKGKEMKWKKSTIELKN